MGKVEMFLIEFDNQNAVYYSGQILNGNVVIRIRERLKINCIKLEVKGMARVHWTETHSSGKTRTTRHYNGYEDLLNGFFILVSKQDNMDLYLEPGIYTYPFRLMLPSTLPTCFEHTYGRIRYSANGTVDIPWSLNKHTSRSFTVINTLDLNMYPSLKMPYGVNGEKTFCCGICKSEPIIATLAAKKCGFVPGERVYFDITIDNRSNKELDSLRVMILQQMRFHATTKSRSCSRPIITLKLDRNVAPRTFDSFTNMSMIIPAVCSSTNGTCRIIDVSYSLCLSFGATGPSINGNIYVPLTIGTVPFQEERTPPAMDGSSSIGMGTFSPSAPPSYEACIFGSEMPSDQNFGNGEVYSNDADSYRPQYPYYKDFS